MNNKQGTLEYFDKSKKSTLEKLYKPDRSKKGDVDIDAIPVIDAINSKDNYYTTSSCSGRISLFQEALSGRKDHSGWIFVKHDCVTENEILDGMSKISKDSSETVWFRQEAPIFHIACRTNEDAKKILEICRDLGLKHSGIIGQSKRSIVEVIFNDKIDVPIAADGEKFVENKFIKFLIKNANDKFSKNTKLLKKFEKEIVKQL